MSKTKIPAASPTPPQARPIRSFARREGRLTASQKKALERLWGHYGLALETEPLNLTAVFDRQAPRILEIGFGNGESLIAQAQTTPETDFLGVEVYRPGIGHLLLRLESERLNNVRVICGDVLDILCYLPHRSLEGVQIFFPDPWPKKRHHKRRLIQPPFIESLWHKMKPEGRLHLATDWQDYAEQTIAVLNRHHGFHRFTEAAHLTDGFGERPLTKFEQRGRQQGRRIWELEFKRSSERLQSIHRQGTQPL